MADFDPLAYAQQQASAEPPPFDPLAYAQAVAADPKKQVAIEPEHPVKGSEATDGPLGFINGLAETAGKGILNIPYNAMHGAQDVLRRGLLSDTSAPDSDTINALHFPLSQNAQNVASSIGETFRPLKDALGNEIKSVATDKELATVKKAAPIVQDAVAMLPAANAVKGGASAIADLDFSAPKLTPTGAPAAPTVSDKILAKAREAGYVVPPVTTNPTMLNRTIEGIAGKANVAQAASIKNQVVTNGLARKALGLPEDAPLTTDTLDDLRAEAGKSYAKVADAGTITVDDKYHSDLADLTKTSTKINKDFPTYASGPQAQIKELSEQLKPSNNQMDAGTAVELSKDLRYNANANENMAARTGDPTAKSMARAQRDAAEAIEDQVKRHLQANGMPELADEWDDARTHIAKTYTVQKALDGAGNVDASKLGKALKNKNYNDDLQTAGDFANAFPKAARVQAGKESMPGLSPLDVYGSVTASLATGSPIPMALGPGRILARHLALSGQNPKSP
jgi:hypothetical protein